MIDDIDIFLMWYLFNVSNLRIEMFWMYLLVKLKIWKEFVLKRIRALFIVVIFEEFVDVCGLK